MKIYRVLTLAVLALATISSLNAQDTTQLKSRGTTSVTPGQAAAPGTETDLAVKRNHRGHSATDVKTARANAPLAASVLVAISIPSPTPQKVVRPDPGFFGFPGLTHFDQRFSGSGKYANTNFSLEPPDQGLCVGDGFVMEAVNDALAVYSASGTLLSGPTALSQFYGLAPEIVRPNGPFGPFISDPKCYFDRDTRRWFVTELEIDTDPTTGAFANHSSVLIAVSQTSDPKGKYYLFSFDTTDAGHPGCSTGCFGDQPLIGADANGFYVSTNEFPISGPGFNGTQLYAMSKTALEAGKLPTIVHIDVGETIPTPDVGGIWYSVQPATSPNSSQESEDEGGTEFFLSALQFGPAPFDNRVAVWALTNTGSLSSVKPHVKLQDVVITSEAYGVVGSFSATAKSGSSPLGDALGNPLEQINANDDRMNQVVFAGGNLYAGVNTSVAIKGQTLQGIAYFVVKPSLDDGVLKAKVSNQGYVAVANENVLFPSIGVTANGAAAIAFSLSGPDYFPSAAYAPLGDKAGNIRLAGPGVGPDDGFTGYAAEGGNGIGRWGDYSAAVADGDGNIGLAG